MEWGMLLVWRLWFGGRGEVYHFPVSLSGGGVCRESFLKPEVESEQSPERLLLGMGAMSGKVRARVSREFQVSAERVYDTWLDPEQVRLWMGSALRGFGLAGEMRRVEIDPRVGGKFFFSDMRGEMEARHWGSYLVLKRPREIVFTWVTSPEEEADPSQVTLRIEPEGEGCRVTIEHEMDEKWQEYIPQTEKGWERMLKGVEDLA